MMNYNQFQKAVDNNQKKEPLIKDTILAFLGGGVLGLISQGLIDLYSLYFNKEESMALTSISVVFVTALLTLIGVYKKIGKIFGAGLFIPTTGFANSITSASMEGRHEGFILGIGSNIFSLAGSVITYGVVFSCLFLIIRFILMIIGVWA